MDENMKIKIEKWIQEDGRRAERRITETKFDSEGQAERTIELHIEDARPLKLQQRIVEKIKPVMFERKIETINPLTGEIVERKVETIEQTVPMQVVDHIGVLDSNKKTDPVVESNFESSMPEGAPAYLQSKDLQMLVDLLKNSQNADSSEFETKLKSLGAAAQVAKKSKKETFSNDKFLMVVIVAQVIALGYVLFFM